MSKYRTKKGGGCKFCKPHKGGWCPKHKKKYEERLEEMKKEGRTIVRIDTFEQFIYELEKQL